MQRDNKIGRKLKGCTRPRARAIERRKQKGRDMDRDRQGRREGVG